MAPGCQLDRSRLGWTACLSRFVSGFLLHDALTTWYREEAADFCGFRFAECGAIFRCGTLLVPAFAGSNPAAPANAESAELFTRLPLNPAAVRSSLPSETIPLNYASTAAKCGLSASRRRVLSVRASKVLFPTSGSQSADGNPATGCVRCNCEGRPKRHPRPNLERGSNVYTEGYGFNHDQ